MSITGFVRYKESTLSTGLMVRIPRSPAAIELALCVVVGKIGFHVIAVSAHVNKSKNEKTKTKTKNNSYMQILAVDVVSYNPRRLTHFNNFNTLPLRASERV